MKKGKEETEREREREKQGKKDQANYGIMVQQKYDWS